MRAWPVGLIGLLSPLLCAGLWSWETYQQAEKGKTGPFQRPSKRVHQAVLCTAWLYLIKRAVLSMACAFFICGVNILSTHLSHTLEIDKCSCKTVWTVSIDKAVSWTIFSVLIFAIFKNPLVDFLDISFRAPCNLTTKMMFVLNFLPS